MAEQLLVDAQLFLCSRHMSSVVGPMERVSFHTEEITAYAQERFTGTAGPKFVLGHHTIQHLDTMN